MSTQPAPELTEEDPTLHRVHHHSWVLYRVRVLGGDAAPTICGIRSKPPNPDADSLPCCPICWEMLRGMGKQCIADPEVTV